ncbi:hypothetical protein [Kitasatospora aureofaciens]|uniref:hypothetical protein n=1 Tax=Kitasatospora aureofaciens TaxID=1894 RepID=UPI0036F4A397
MSLSQWWTRSRPGWRRDRKKLHEAGVKSEHAYLAGVASIGLSFASWMVSVKVEGAGVERADRWGILVGEWAPTLCCGVRAGRSVWMRASRRA